jgi:acyl carrier protein
MTLRQTIIDTLISVAFYSQATLVDPLTDDTVLLQSGLDSLGFAALVAQLEEDLGFDPFTMTDEPIYPRTLGEFIGFYEKMAGQKL